jgi:hypothetical protein
VDSGGKALPRKLAEVTETALNQRPRAVSTRMHGPSPRPALLSLTTAARVAEAGYPERLLSKKEMKRVCSHAADAPRTGVPCCFRQVRCVPRQRFSSTLPGRTLPPLYRRSMAASLREVSRYTFCRELEANLRTEHSWLPTTRATTLAFPAMMNRRMTTCRSASRNA